MITGNVNSDHEPIIEMILHDVNAQEHKRPDVVDTNFRGWLTLPPSLIAALGLPWKQLGRRFWQMAVKYTLTFTS